MDRIAQIQERVCCQKIQGKKEVLEKVVKLAMSKFSKEFKQNKDWEYLLNVVTGWSLVIGRKQCRG